MPWAWGPWRPGAGQPHARPSRIWTSGSGGVGDSRTQAQGGSRPRFSSQVERPDSWPCCLPFPGCGLGEWWGHTLPPWTSSAPSACLWAPLLLLPGPLAPQALAFLTSHRLNGINSFPRGALPFTPHTVPATTHLLPSSAQVLLDHLSVHQTYPPVWTHTASYAGRAWCPVTLAGQGT